MKLIVEHENSMFQDGVIGPNEKNFLISLESAICDFSKRRACNGAFYLTLFRQGDHFFARIIESGSLIGEFHNQYDYIAANRHVFTVTNRLFRTGTGFRFLP